MLRLAIMVSLLASGCKGPAGVEALGHTFVQHLAAGRYAEAAGMYDATMARSLPVPDLRAVWESAVLTHGAFVAVADIREERILRATRVALEVEMARAFVDIVVVINSRRQVASLWLRPSPRKKPRVEVSPPEGVVARPLTVGLPDWPLGATLTLPEGRGPWPTMLMVHGSGPQDRDESIGPNAPFRDLAWGLALRGVATLRYDKRTKVHAERFEGEAGQQITIDQETVDDAAEILANMHREPPTGVDASRVWILGHSLGGTWAPRIAERVRAQGGDIAGIVILAGATRMLQDLMVTQAAYLAARGGFTDAERDAVVDARAAAARISAGEPAGSRKNQMPLGLPPSYWRSLENYRPAVAAARLAVPLLLLQGLRDYQVTVEDYAGWQKVLAGKPGVKLMTFAALNHLFMTGEGPPGPEEYAREATVAPEVIDAIAGFVRDGRPESSGAAAAAEP